MICQHTDGPHHNANPPTEAARAIRGLEATIAQLERYLSRLKTLVAELKRFAEQAEN